MGAFGITLAWVIETLYVIQAEKRRNSSSTTSVSSASRIKIARKAVIGKLKDFQLLLQLF